MISGSLVLVLVVAVILIYGIFFSPLTPRIPSWLRTIFVIILAVVAFAWLLNLLGFVAF